MNSHLLYFPYINVPDTAWTYRLLLYYDTLSAIVPQEFIYDGARYEPFMAQLVNAHLVRPIDPIHHIRDHWELHRKIMAHIQLPQYQLQQKRADFASMRTLPHYQPTRISEEKFVYHVLDDLVRERLAVNLQGKFFDVEPTIAKLIMLLLTDSIAKPLQLQPVTDDSYHLGVRFSNRNNQIYSPEITERRNKLLEGIMPGPQFIELDKLLDFKMKYADLLYRFRLMAEQIATDERYDNKDFLELKIAELNLLREDLTAYMSENKFKKIMGTGLFAVTNIIGTLIGVNSLSAGLTAISAVKGSFSEITHNPEQANDVSGMKYLALVHKKL